MCSSIPSKVPSSWGQTSLAGRRFLWGRSSISSINSWASAQGWPQRSRCWPYPWWRSSSGFAKSIRSGQRKTGPTSCSLTTRRSGLSTLGGRWWVDRGRLTTTIKSTLLALLNIRPQWWSGVVLAAAGAEAAITFCPKTRPWPETGKSQF